jgi:hypothetical protein
MSQKLLSLFVSSNTSSWRNQPTIYWRSSLRRDSSRGGIPGVPPVGKCEAIAGTETFRGGHQKTARTEGG